VRKYWGLAKATFQEYFTYRLNFILWRFRAVIQLAILFFLWSTAFSGQTVVFGYTQAQMLTYILGVSLIRSYILAARLSEGVGAEIVTGNITNILLKPMSYLRYVFSRDLSDKFINIFFSSIEITGFILLFHPPLIWQTQPFYVLSFIASLLLALMLYFFINMAISYTAFWLVEDWWAPRFMFGIILDFLAGGLFPVDILPPIMVKILAFTPFPYILFFPIKIYLGQLSYFQVLQGLGVVLVWTWLAYLLQRYTWRKGLRQYEAIGR